MIFSDVGQGKEYILTIDFQMVLNDSSLPEAWTQSVQEADYEGIPLLTIVFWQE